MEGVGQKDITFDIKKDHKARNDETLHTGVKNGDTISALKGTGIYIANPKHASGQFRIRVSIHEE